MYVTTVRKMRLNSCFFTAERNKNVPKMCILKVFLKLNVNFMGFCVGFLYYLYPSTFEYTPFCKVKRGKNKQYNFIAEESRHFVPVHALMT